MHAEVTFKAAAICSRAALREIYDECNQILGTAKIAAIMISERFKVSNEMVRTFMRDMGLVSIRQFAKKLYENEGRKYKITLTKSLTRANRTKYR